MSTRTVRTLNKAAYDEYEHSGNRTIVNNGNIQKQSYSIVATVGTSNANRTDLYEARAKMQADMNIKAKIAEEKRQEKEREKLKAKIEKYEKMGFLINGETCGPSQTVVEHTNAMASARYSMQNRLDELLHAEERLEMERTERERLLAEQLEEERKKNQFLKIKIARMKMQEELEKSENVLSSDNKLGNMKLARIKSSPPNYELKKQELTEEERQKKLVEEMRLARIKMQEDFNNQLKNLELPKPEE